MIRSFVPLAVAALVAMTGSSAAAQSSRCADCHFAQALDVAPTHLFNWDRSPHGQAGVGCDKCHGGNPGPFEKALAHRGMVRPGNRRSPVAAANLPATCGVCHRGPAAAFQKSRHFEVLRSGGQDGPTCSTCHETVGGELLSPKALEAQCNRCHGAKEVAPRAERARQARAMYENLGVIRKELALASAMIRKVDDRQRRADLMSALQQAREPVVRAVEAGHTFVYDELNRQLSDAQTRVERLLSQIANRAQ